VTGNWLFVALGLLFGAYLATLAYLLRQGATREPSAAGTGGGATATDGEESVTEDAVYCPNCSTENERGYKFCRECLAELPTSVSFFRGRSGPRRRMT